MIDLSTEEDDLINTINESYSTAISTSIADQKSTQLNFICENSVQILSNYFKLNADYQNLSQETQKILFKWRLADLIILHYSIATDHHSVDFENNEHSLEKCVGKEKFAQIIELANDFLDICEENQVIIKLMLLVLIFDPENDLISRKQSNDIDLIRSLHVKYSNLLYKYICSWFDYPVAILKFSHLVCLLREVFKVTYSMRNLSLMDCLL
jgi:hypothetical protein